MSRLLLGQRLYGLHLFELHEADSGPMDLIGEMQRPHHFAEQALSVRRLVRASQ